MAVVEQYSGQALPLYGRLVVIDPRVTDEEHDLSAAFDRAYREVAAASTRRIIIHAGQDTAAITISVQIYDAQPVAEPDGSWDGQRTLATTFPHGQMIVDNISAGPIDLHPGPVTQVALPTGPGDYHAQLWYRGRDLAARRVSELWEQDDADDDVAAQTGELAGLEQYLLRLWPA